MRRPGPRRLDGHLGLLRLGARPSDQPGSGLLGQPEGTPPATTRPAHTSDPGPRRPDGQSAQGYDTGSAPGPRRPDDHLQVVPAGPWPRTGYRGIRLLAALGAGVLVLASSLLASPLPPAAADDPGPDPATQPTASDPDQGTGPGQTVPGQAVPGQPTGLGQGALPGGQGSASGQGMVPAAQPTAQASAPGTECVPGVEHLVNQPPPAVAQLGFSRAWGLSRGGVVVAVVDTGVDASNTHLGDAVLAGTDLLDAGDGRTDSSGHGTAVAGQIAARPVPGSGVVGMAPDSLILPVRVYQDGSSEAVRAGRGPDAARTAEGIRWAVDHGAVIVVVPQSTPSDVEALRSAVDYATAAGALVVASAGNANAQEDTTAVRFPAGYPSVLSVTAVDANGMPSDAVVHGTHVEVAAPGAGVLTTFMGSGDCMLAGATPTTSYATGYVGAAAALVAAAYPQESPADWEYRILATALRPTPSVRSTTLGWGLLAPYDALNLVNDGTTVGPPNPRFPAPVPPAPVLMARPEEVTDTLAPRRHLVLTALGAGAATLVLTVLTVARLRRRRV